jgi:iron complex transport system ATP-binding protein
LLWRPQTGKVFFQGRDFQKFSPRERARSISYVPQQSLLHFSLSVEEVVAQGRYATLHSLFRQTSQDSLVVEEALEVVGATPLKKRVFPELSGGEQQRVLLARALASQAPVLFLDEPTSSLDIRYVVELKILFKKLAKHGKTLVLALHDLNTAKELADQILLLQGGRLYGKGTPTEVLTAQALAQVYGVQEEPQSASRFSLSSS